MTDVIDTARIESTIADLRCRIKSCVEESEYLPAGAARQVIYSSALTWITDLTAAVLRQSGDWLDPLITDNDDEQVVFEWWHGDKKLTSRVGPEGVELIKRWGVRKARQRDEIASPSLAQMVKWWTWFTRDGE